MKKIKLTKEQDILFKVYDKGVQNEDCDLDAYLEKMKQALSIADVSNQRELLISFSEKWNEINDIADSPVIYDSFIEDYLKGNL